MAEPIAIVGIVASIVQLVEFGSKVLHRLNDFQSSLDDVPESFRHIKTELPLLLITLQRTKEGLDAGVVDDNTKQSVCDAIAGCRAQIESLDKLLIKSLPATGDSWSKKSKKAVVSLYLDSKVKELVTTLRDYVQTLTFYHAAASSTLQPSAADEQLTIVRWLSAPDPLPNYQKALKQRLVHTGSWFLKSQRYSNWKSNEASVLWLYGIPGCGKTILSSAIIQELLSDDPSKIVAFFYFDFKDSMKQTPDLMVKSLITQLSRCGIKIPSAVQQLYISCAKGQQQPSLDALLATLQQIFWELPESYIVLDALDECNHRTELMEIIEEIVGWRVAKTHLLVTSRKEREIESSLQLLVDDGNAICLQSNLVDKDIQSYIDHRLSTDKKLKKWHQDSGVRQEIEAALMNKAKGMFRWATCQLDSLGQCRNRLQLRKSLVTLPSTLDETYDRILRGIREEDSKYAMRILQWLAFSARPLRVEEVAEVVALDSEREPAFELDEILQDPLEALEICSSLVTIPQSDADVSTQDEDDSDYEARSLPDTENTIVLAHYSVKEYLISERICQDLAPKYSIKETRCNTLIAERCLKYLLQFQDRNPFDEGIDKLARYSAEFWIYHVHRAQTNVTSLNMLIMELFSGARAAYINWIRLFDVEGFLTPDSPSDLIPAPLYHASLAGLTDIVALMLTNETGVDVNAEGGVFHSALQVASFRGNEKIVEQLLQAGADANAEGGLYKSSLRAASTRGHETIVRQLLQAGANVNAGPGWERALYTASYGGHEKIVELLLQAGANVNAGKGSERALYAASYGGHEKIVELLLQAGANVNAGKGWERALYAASTDGNERIIELLLQAKADVNAEGGLFGSALCAASSQGHEKIVELLLKAGANVNAEGSYGNSLELASEGSYGNSLELASRNGHQKIVTLLLEAGAIWNGNLDSEDA